MTGKKLLLLLSATLIAGITFFGVPMDKSINIKIPARVPLADTVSTMHLQLPGWLTQQVAAAAPYRRSVRRTARRTSRRTAKRVSYRHGGGYYAPPRPHAGAAVAVGTMIAVGTIVSTLPPACNTVYVNGIAYRNCSGIYYAPQGTQWIVVDAP